MMCHGFPRNAGTTELQRAAEKNQVEIHAGIEVRSAPVLLLNRLLRVCMAVVTLIVICASLFLSVFLKASNHIDMRDQTHGCDLSPCIPFSGSVCVRACVCVCVSVSDIHTSAPHQPVV